MAISPRRGDVVLAPLALPATLKVLHELFAPWRWRAMSRQERRRWLPLLLGSSLLGVVGRSAHSQTEPIRPIFPASERSLSTVTSRTNLSYRGTQVPVVSFDFDGDLTGLRLALGNTRERGVVSVVSGSHRAPGPGAARVSLLDVDVGASAGWVRLAGSDRTQLDLIGDVRLGYARLRSRESPGADIGATMWRAFAGPGVRLLARLNSVLTFESRGSGLLGYAFRWSGRQYGVSDLSYLFSAESAVLAERLVGPFGLVVGGSWDGRHLDAPLREYFPTSEDVLFPYSGGSWLLRVGVAW